MTTILISVLAPVALLAWWAVIVTTARDNEVVPEHVLHWIVLRKAVMRWQARMVAQVADITRAFQAMSAEIGKLKGPLAEMQRALARIEGQ